MFLRVCDYWRSKIKAKYPFVLGSVHFISFKKIYFEIHSCVQASDDSAAPTIRCKPPYLSFDLVFWSLIDSVHLVFSSGFISDWLALSPCQMHAGNGECRIVAGWKCSKGFQMWAVSLWAHWSSVRLFCPFHALWCCALKHTSCWIFNNWH